MRWLFRCTVAAWGVAGILTACSSFDSPSIGAGPDGGTLDDSGTAPSIDAASPAADATLTDDAASDAGLSCTTTCRSGHCDSDGGCHPLAFVTEQVFDGAMLNDGGPKSGTERADALCTWIADGGTFMALLGGGQDHDTITRITDIGNGSQRPVWQADGTMIAPSYQHLFDEAPSPPLTRTVTNGEVVAQHHVWTGTTANGSASQQSCSGWADSLPGDHGTYGQVGVDSGYWVEANTETCDIQNHLYCLEIVP